MFVHIYFVFRCSVLAKSSLLLLLLKSSLLLHNSINCVYSINSWHFCGCTVGIYCLLLSSLRCLKSFVGCWKKSDHKTPLSRLQLNNNSKMDYLADTQWTLNFSVTKLLEVIDEGCALLSFLVRRFFRATNCDVQCGFCASEAINM